MKGTTDPGRMDGLLPDELFRDACEDALAYDLCGGCGMESGHEDSTLESIRGTRAARAVMGVLAVVLVVVASACRSAANEHGAQTTSGAAAKEETFRALIPLTRADGRPLGPLALAGREVFVREGCFVCHTVAPREGIAGARWPDEEVRALPGPQVAPELDGIGGRYTATWHTVHLVEPRSVRPGSIMPAYPFLLDRSIGPEVVGRVVALQRELGLDAADRSAVQAALTAAAQPIAARVDIDRNGRKLAPNAEATALIAYLQQLDRVPDSPAAETPPDAPDPEAIDASLRARVQELAGAGRALFQRHCVSCHGPRARIGPALGEGERRPSDVRRFIVHGAPEKGCPAWGEILKPDQLDALAAWVTVALPDEDASP